MVVPKEKARNQMFRNVLLILTSLTVTAVYIIMFMVNKQVPVPFLWFCGIQAVNGSVLSAADVLAIIRR